MAGFAVVDVETTGFNARGGDRIVEIAVVHADEFGRVTGQWQTVLQPDRDLGEAAFHGLREVEVIGAPGFGEIADSLAALLWGRVLVAHNAAFVETFLDAEYRRIGGELPSVKTLCTMQMSKPNVKGFKRSLEACCKAMDVSLDESRAALGDATATAQLLAAFMAKGGVSEWVALSREVGEKSSVQVPDTSNWRARGGLTWRLSGAGAKRGIGENPRDYEWLKEHAEYLAALEEALLDRLLSPDETQGLAGLAGKLGLGREEVKVLHGEFFRLVVRVALRDGVLTKAEKADLAVVGELLGLREGERRAIVKEEKGPSGTVMYTGIDIEDVGDVFSGIGAVVKGAGRALRDAILDIDVSL